MTVNTKSVAGRRRLRFTCYQDILDDVRELARGPHRQLGNWSLGQICQHLAVAMNAGVDGPPFQPRWYYRLIGMLIKKRVLKGGLTPGFQLPKEAQALVPGESVSSESVQAIERAVERLSTATRFHPHLLLGNLTAGEWEQFSLRHAELHLSFLVPA